MFRGKLVDCHEVPDRLDDVLTEIKRCNVGTVLSPSESISDASLQAALEAVHTREYLSFLQTAWDEWIALDPSNAERDALPSVWLLYQQYAFRKDRCALAAVQAVLAG